MIFLLSVVWQNVRWCLIFQELSVSVNVLQFHHLLHFDVIFEKTWWPKLDIHPMRIEFPLHTPKYNESFFYCRVWDQVKLPREASNTSELFDQVFGFLKCCTLSMKMLPLSLDGGAVFRVYTSKMLTVILPLYSRKFPLKWKQTKLRAVRRLTSISSNYPGFKREFKSTNFQF